MIPVARFPAFARVACSKNPIVSRVIHYGGFCSQALLRDSMMVWRGKLAHIDAFMVGLDFRQTNNRLQRSFIWMVWQSSLWGVESVYLVLSYSIY